MSAFVLGAITFNHPESVQAWTGFDYPETAQVVRLLGDGVDVGNAVVQQSAIPFREATISGTLTSSTDVGNLRTYYAGKTVQTFTDNDGTNYSVEIFDLVVSLIYPSVWTYSCRLVEVSPPTWVADFTATPTSGSSPLAVTFTASGTASVGVPVSVVWDFDDGTVSVTRNPSHTYTGAATYNPVMTALFPDGTTATATHAITVS